MILKLARLIGAAAVLYALLVAFVYFKQRSLLYFPTPQKFNISDMNLGGLREVTVHTSDGLDIDGWYVPSAREDKATIVRFHGNGSNVLWNMDAMRAFVEDGYGALSVEYRGYSGNPGKPDENGLYRDARAFMDWLKNEGVPEESIVIYGESVGTGPAVQMALDYPNAMSLILQTPFTSITDVARLHYPFLPVNWLLKDRFDSIGKIKNITMPLIIVHGTADRVVPYALGKQLFDAAPEPKTLITVENADHNDLAEFNVDQKISTILKEQKRI